LFIVQLPQLIHQVGNRHGFSARQRVGARGFDSSGDLRDGDHAEDIATKKNARQTWRAF
jgi:hypothetical protein